MDDGELLRRAIAFTCASVIEVNETRHRVLAETAMLTLIDLAHLRGGTSDKFVRRDVLEAVYGEVMAVIKDRLSATTPKLAAAVAGITDEREIISAYREALAENLAIRQ